MDERLAPGRRSDPSAHTVRAQRFLLEMAVRFRPVGAEGWIDGQCVNVSQSGVLFVTGWPAASAGIEIELTLEMSVLGPRVANVTCRGRIVRTGSIRTREVLVGARIESYEFLPSLPLPSRS